MTYKDVETQYIGCSDKAMLHLIGGTTDPDEHNEYNLCFGEDGAYEAYITDQKVSLGSHYKLEATFYRWLMIYDDEELTKELKAKKISVYRAGNFGCFIQLDNE